MRIDADRFDRSSASTNRRASRRIEPANGTAGKAPPTPHADRSDSACPFTLASILVPSFIGCDPTRPSTVAVILPARASTALNS